VLDKPCEQCGVEMLHVQKNRRFCKHCRLVRAREPARRRYDVEYQRRYRAANVEKFQMLRRRSSLRAMGLMVEEFNSLIAAQDGRCAICGTTEPGGNPASNGKGGWHVDHSHTVGCHPQKGSACDKCRRGLLCGSCNRGLGYFFDDPARLRAAAAYIESY
jgi:hypothetical protein